MQQRVDVFSSVFRIAPFASPLDEKRFAFNHSGKIILPASALQIIGPAASPDPQQRSGWCTP